MDIADQAENSAQNQQGTKMNKIMSAGDSLQAGGPAQTKTCTDPKWARISPGTISPSGQTFASNTTGQHRVTSSGIEEI